MAPRSRRIRALKVEPAKHLRGVTCINEETVLRPVPKALDPDDWPCFVLKNAVVYSKDGKTVTNLLNAELRGPLTIRGKLQVDPDLRHLQKTHNLKGVETEVTDVREYSIGIDPVTIWARGKSGWFEIRPAIVYESIFKKMVDGVILYYFLTDLYESKKVSYHKTLNVDEIYCQYAEQIDKVISASEFQQRCEEQAEFLLSQMRRPRESIQWNNTQIFQWLVERCPEIHARYRRITAIRGSVAEAATVAIQTDDTVAEQEKSTMSTVVFPHSSAKSHISTTDAILETINQLYEVGHLQRQNIDIHDVSEALYERYDITSEELAKEIVKSRAKPLCAALGSGWAHSLVYSKLKQLQIQPEKGTSSLRKEAKNTVLNLRVTGDKSTSNVAQAGPGDDAEVTKVAVRGRLKKRTSSQSEHEEDSKFSEQSNVRNQRKDKGKDKRPVTPEAMLPICRTSSRSGKVASLRLAPSSPAENRSLLSPNAEEYEDRGSRKRRKISHSPSREDVGDADSSYGSPEMESEENDDDELLSIKGELYIKSERLLSTEPQGPNGLWECSREGCGYYVAGADKPAGKAKMRAHFLEHADEIAARENIVIAESKPYLSINHLLEKLRSLGEAARLAEQKKIAGRVVPEPIKRHLVI